jgi:DNA-binding winged helix-turn-helix (wHTH) protein
VPCYRFGPFELDTDARQLRRGTDVVPVAGKTLETLIVLLENRGHLVNKETLFASVWQGSVVEEANLTQAVFLQFASCWMTVLEITATLPR